MIRIPVILADTTTIYDNVFILSLYLISLFLLIRLIENTPTTFNNLASPDAVSFKWVFGDGDSLLTTSRLPVEHQYNATGTYNACLIAI